MRNAEKLEKVVRWMKAKNYAASTIETYHSFLVKFFDWAQEDSIRISEARILEYMLSIPDNYSNSYRNQAVNAIRLYFKVAEHRFVRQINLPRPKRDQYIPNVLNPDQIHNVIFNTLNLKHRAILYTIYHCGLRISELINLTWADLRSKADPPHLLIRKAKGHKSRAIPVTEEYIKIIKEYYIKYYACTDTTCRVPTRAINPDAYIFQGEHGPYSKTSIRNILRAALMREGIQTPTRVHDLRHAFATHCLASETNIHHLSKILGHKSVKTTENIYAHLQLNQIRIHRTAI